MNHSHEHSGTVILFTDDGLGHAEPELRRKLSRIYLTMLLENRFIPEAICFYGDGVKLVIDSSPVLDLLKQLEDLGVILISCVTCINHYSLAEKVAVGVIGGMHDIVAAQWKATKVITL
jgi:hypothetical protein